MAYYSFLMDSAIAAQLDDPTKGRYEALSDIAADVDRHEGVLTLSMWQVRDAYGAGRLGVNVCANISDELENLGLQHIPSQVPSDQWAQIRLWKPKSAVGKLIHAARKPGHEYDERLRQAAAGEANLILAKVKELVCDGS